MLMDYSQRVTRRPERWNGGPFQEKWNTISNLPFIVIGLCRLKQWEDDEDMMMLYYFYLMAGVCSGIHHALSFRGSLILDWIPILFSIGLWVYYELWSYISWGTWVQVALALAILLTDHLVQLVPVPWGHVMWHIAAAQSIDSAYQDFAYHMH